MTHPLTALVGLALLAQDPAPPDDTPIAEPEPVSASALRERIHDMRMNLILGGDRVRAAESEAVSFFEQKGTEIDQRIDVLQSELSQLRASYDIALDRALNDEDAAVRQSAMREASALKGEIADLEGKVQSLDNKSRDLSRYIQAVGARSHERELLAAELEATSDLDSEFVIPFGSIGLAPQLPPEDLPFSLDEAFIADLLERDPRAARQLIYEADPGGYWQRFPLTPPAPVLSSALSFPPPDLPGSR